MVQKRYAALLADMKNLEREHMKVKRKHDVVQKERDTAKSELSKLTSMRDKLEKLSRETSTENRKLRVSFCQ
jgi:ribosome-binding ATPase YchF (GTP1/OBG family)